MQKILVVDDSETVLKATQLALEGAGFKVVTLSNPVLFPTVLGRERPDAVLLDVEMPAITGAALASLALKNQVHSCPILLFSGRPLDELRKMAVDCGAAGFVQKTNEASALVEQVQIYLPEKSSAIPETDEVFLVDDQKIVLTLLEVYVRRGDAKPVLLENAEAALELGKSRIPAMIVLDLQLNGMQGDEACRAIRANPTLRQVPVVLMTGRAKTSVLEQCWRVGVDDFLPKPVRPEQLEAKIRAVRLRKTAPSPATEHKPQKVVLATADELHQMQLGLHLELSGYVIRRATSMAEAKLAFAEGFDAAVCDARMFVDGGREMLQDVRAHAQKLVLLVSEQVPASISADFDSWAGPRTAIVRPPHSPELVMARVNSMLRKVASDLRIEQRVPYYAVVEFRTDPKAPWNTGITHDLSPNGLFVRTLTPAKSDAEVEFRFGEWPLAEAFEGKAHVAWSNEYGARTTYGYPVGMGLEISEMKESEKARLRSAYDAARKATGN